MSAHVSFCRYRFFPHQLKIQWPYVMFNQSDFHKKMYVDGVVVTKWNNGYRKIYKTLIDNQEI